MRFKALAAALLLFPVVAWGSLNASNVPLTASLPISITSNVISGETLVVLASDQTTSSSTIGDVTGMSFAVGANQTYVVQINLFTGMDNTGGSKFAINGPTGATMRFWAFGVNTGSTTYRGESITALNTLSGAFGALSSAALWVQITGLFVTSSTTGTFQLRYASTTNTQTTSVFAKSWIRAQRQN